MLSSLNLNRSQCKKSIDRKTVNDRTLYPSRSLPIISGTLLLCDLSGAGRFDEKRTEDIMRDIYIRAPEVRMERDYQVSIWNFAILVSRAGDKYHLQGSFRDSVFLVASLPSFWARRHWHLR